jgi:uncharacterized membrane protein
MIKTEKSNNAAKRIFFLNLCIVLLFTKSVRWTTGLTIKKIIVIVFFYLFLLVIIPFIVKNSKTLSKKINELFEWFYNGLNYCRNNWKSIIIKAFVYVLSAIVCYALSQAYAVLKSQNYSYFVTYLLIGLSYIAISTFYLRKSISAKPERLFLCVLMISGITYTCAMPASVGITWDDQIHYERIVSLADFADNTSYKAELDVYNTIADRTLMDKKLNREDNAAFSEKLNRSYKADETVDLLADYGIYSIAYIPYAAGIILGRALSMPFTWQLLLGKIVNLLFYGMVVSLAMKKLKSGKLLMAVIALFPTMILLTANYSYDSWVLCFAIYGFASFFGMLQNKNEKVNKFEITMMLLAFILGCLPKAIYFIMMLPLFFLPKNRFSDSKKYHKYLILVLCSGLLLAGSFVLPMLVNGAGSGDARGGADVNSTEQIKFILSNPIGYIAILMNFMKDYLNLNQVNGYVQSFAYLGDGIFKSSSLLVVGFVALLDKDGNNHTNKLIRFSSLIGCFMALCLAATALYISFTPVGENTIAGCQVRYIVPVLFPILYMITPDSIVNNLKKNLYYTLPIIYMATIFMIDWVLLVNEFAI